MQPLQPEAVLGGVGVHLVLGTKRAVVDLRGAVFALEFALWLRRQDGGSIALGEKQFILGLESYYMHRCLDSIKRNIEF